MEEKRSNRIIATAKKLNLSLEHISNIPDTNFVKDIIFLTNSGQSKVANAKLTFAINTLNILEPHLTSTDYEWGIAIINELKCAIMQRNE